ncbi:hypothetical protein B0H16DRAFT_1749278 [Mycena metata]|uniref:Uncharacterized protein n=1 Tax=Mycena metata TaxID=1033252 RepID=A0AAD7DU11_9AGAR|nr:hypothetical protein B0H16DRAFT_1749278 [Mycena metata]
MTRRFNALKTIQTCGTPQEADQAAAQLLTEFTSAPVAEVTETEDVQVRLHQMQRANAVLTAPVQPRGRLALDTPIGAASSNHQLVFLPPTSGFPPPSTRKRALDDPSRPHSNQPAKKRKR